MADIKVEIVNIAAITPDARNANKGTERGDQMLENSLQENGAGRSILLDRHLRAIAGNKTHGKAGQVGMDDVILVHTDGTKLVAVVRDDLDLEDDPEGRARKLAYADNRTSEIDLDWDTAQLLADLNEGADLSSFFDDGELTQLLSSHGAAVNDPDAEWVGMPEFEAGQKDNQLIVHFVKDEDKEQFFLVIQQKHDPRVKYIWYPEKQRRTLKNMQVVMEDEPHA